MGTHGFCGPHPCECDCGVTYQENGFLPLTEDSDECYLCRGTGEVCFEGRVILQRMRAAPKSLKKAVPKTTAWILVIFYEDDRMALLGSFSPGSKFGSIDGADDLPSSDPSHWWKSSPTIKDFENNFDLDGTCVNQYSETQCHGGTKNISTGRCNKCNGRWEGGCDFVNAEYECERITIKVS